MLQALAMEALMSAIGSVPIVEIFYEIFFFPTYVRSMYLTF